MKPQSLTNDELNEWIARQQGWTDIRHLGQHHIGTMPGGCAYNVKLPSYCTDLNTMHDAENSIKEMPEFDEYLGIRMRTNYAIGVCGTARQRAEDFYLAMGGEQ